MPTSLLEDERTYSSFDSIQLSYLPSWSLSSSTPSPPTLLSLLAERMSIFTSNTTPLIFVVGAVMVGGAAMAGRPTPARFFPLSGRSSGCGYKRFIIIFIVETFEIALTSFIFLGLYPCFETSSGFSSF